MEQKLVLNYKKSVYFFLLAFSLFLAGCNLSCESDGKKNIYKSFFDNEKLEKYVKQHINAEAKFIFFNHFSKDTLRRVAVVYEVSTRRDWGIRFELYEVKQDSLVNVFLTPLLDGAVDRCDVKLIDLPQYSYNLLYYHSKDYFMGSTGGEIFSYIIDFNRQKTYYAHFINTFEVRNSLYISKNTPKEIKDFFLAEFRKDTPNLRLITKDIKIE